MDIFDIAINICSFNILTYIDLCNLSCVSKKFKHIYSSNEIWKSLKLFTFDDDSNIKFNYKHILTK